MFVTLTDSKRGIPVLVNLDRVLYAYRQTQRDATVLVFGKVAGSGARSVAVAVDETLPEIQRRRRMAGD